MDILNLFCYLSKHVTFVCVHNAYLFQSHQSLDPQPTAPQYQPTNQPGSSGLSPNVAKTSGAASKTLFTSTNSKLEKKKAQKIT